MHKIQVAGGSGAAGGTVCTRIRELKKPQALANLGLLVWCRREDCRRHYRIQIDVKGVRDAATFPTARDCNEWAAHRRVELMAAAAGGKAGARLMGESWTLNDTMLRYKEEVSPGKRGWRWEQIRIDAIIKHLKWPGMRPISELDEQDLIGWKNERRKTVKDSTVCRAAHGGMAAATAGHAADAQTLGAAWPVIPTLSLPAAGIVPQD